MLKKLWLVFAQAVTVELALLFTFATLRPEWLPQRPSADRPASLADWATEGTASAPMPARATGTVEAMCSRSILSYSEGAQRATAAVVNIYTTTNGRPADHPLLNDPLFRRF